MDETKKIEKMWKKPEAGSFNVAPAGWREISQDKFAALFFAYSPDHEEYRQIHRTIDGQSCLIDNIFLTTRLYWYRDGTGLAMVNVYSKQTGYKHQIRYFAFGCDHQYAERSAAELRERGIHIIMTGRCIHHYECEKCGHVHTVDSSD